MSDLTPTNHIMTFIIMHNIKPKSFKGNQNHQINRTFFGTFATRPQPYDERPLLFKYNCVSKFKTRYMELSNKKIKTVDGKP
jgi:hypothetical protein